MKKGRIGFDVRFEHPSDDFKAVTCEDCQLDVDVAGSETTTFEEVLYAINKHLAQHLVDDELGSGEWAVAIRFVIKITEITDHGWRSEKLQLDRGMVRPSQTDRWWYCWSDWPGSS